MAIARGANYTHFSIDEIGVDLGVFDVGIIQYKLNGKWYSHPLCTPSREGLHTAGIPVEEDSVFAPRKVEVECVDANV